MLNRSHRPLFAVTFAATLAVVALFTLTGSLSLAAPPAAPGADLARQETPGATPITGTAGVTDTADHLLHHPEATVTGTETVPVVPGMMGMMGEMMSVMGAMQGMMGPGMMGQAVMGTGTITGTMPMMGMMPITGSLTVSDCMMVGPMMSMMGSMMSMMGAMQTLEGMMAGHDMLGETGMMGPGMMGPGMMGPGMMGSTVPTDTMPMRGAMPMTGSIPFGPGMMGMGMMGSAETSFMLDHMMQMMGQMQALIVGCQQLGQAQAGQPVDLGFIDSMILHHEGAVAMAQQALEQAEREEIRQMAETIIGVQEAEIAQLQEWRSAWFSDAASTPGMGMEMGMMEIEEGEQPFDLRFIDAMISHHEGAIAMAQEALANAQQEDIRLMAQAIIDAQQAEIAQLQAWRSAWYPDAQ